MLLEAAGPTRDIVIDVQPHREPAESPTAGRRPIIDSPTCPPIRQEDPMSEASQPVTTEEAKATIGLGPHGAGFGIPAPPPWLVVIAEQAAARYGPDVVAFLKQAASAGIDALGNAFHLTPRSPS